jgi:hypothetical protein
MPGTEPGHDDVEMVSRKTQIGHMQLPSPCGSTREKALYWAARLRRQLTVRPDHSQDQLEKSFSNCGTSFQTPFSFLLMIVIHCGWNRKPAAASVASMRWASPSSLARSASFGVSTIC